MEGNPSVGEMEPELIFMVCSTSVKMGRIYKFFSRGMSASMKVFVKSKMNSFLSAVDGVLDIQEANVCGRNDAVYKLF